MVFFLGLASSFILLIIALFHFYWAFGGTYGVDKVIPTKDNKTKALHPPTFITLLVALVLLLMGITYQQGAKVYEVTFLPQLLKEYGLMFFSITFIVRAIGDFKYVGFFKRIKNTTFSINDTRYYAPLCLFLGISGILILVLGN